MNQRTVVAVNLVGDEAGGGLGRAHVLGVAEVVDAQVTAWSQHEVGWDVLHDEGPRGSHHARIVRFMREHEVGVVVTGHLGPPMHHTLTALGCKVVSGATGDARAAALAAVDAPASPAPVAGRGHGPRPGPVGPVAISIEPPH
ncbi:MAG: NifB/NifX family molybdenum-iron cluster-binding protein [Micrococcales bacterium]|nr:NifB/NifX family molybdenum-iron cluster-binding protein [Micrococcales bacterium]